MDKNFDRPDFHKFEAPREDGLPYRLETCRAGPRPISLCVEKTKNFDQIHPLRPRPKMDQNFDRPDFRKYEAT